MCLGSRVSCLGVFGAPVNSLLLREDNGTVVSGSSSACAQGTVAVRAQRNAARGFDCVRVSMTVWAPADVPGVGPWCLRAPQPLSVWLSAAGQGTPVVWD